MEGRGGLKLGEFVIATDFTCRGYHPLSEDVYKTLQHTINNSRATHNAQRPPALQAACTLLHYIIFSPTTTAGSLTGDRVLQLQADAEQGGQSEREADLRPP